MNTEWMDDLKKRQVAVDIDGTICEERSNWWEYELCAPYPDAIKVINDLFWAGFTVTYYTARHEADRPVTVKWLNENGCLYHHLMMGKLRANMYIDNNSFRVEELRELLANGNLLR